MVFLVLVFLRDGKEGGAAVTVYPSIGRYFSCLRLGETLAVSCRSLSLESVPPFAFISPSAVSLVTYRIPSFSPTPFPLPPDPLALHHQFIRPRPPTHGFSCRHTDAGAQERLQPLYGDGRG